MGSIKNLYFKLIDLVETIIDSGISDQDLDKEVEKNVDKNEYQFYLDNREKIIDKAMNESLYMPSLEEGCGCGGRKPIIKRNPLTIRKPTKKINEENSQPINKDKLKIAVAKIERNMDKEAIDLFGYKNIGGTYVIYETLKRIIVGHNPQRSFFDACEDENYYGDREDIVKDREEIASVLKEKFNIEVDPFFQKSRLGESKENDYLMQSIFEEHDTDENIKWGKEMLKFHKKYKVKKPKKIK